MANLGNMLNYFNKNLITRLKASTFKAALVFLIFSIQTISLAIGDTPERFTVKEIKTIIRDEKSPAKDIADMIISKMDHITLDDLTELENLLLNSRELDTGTIGLRFIDSDIKVLSALGLELVSDVCITKTEYFQPNTFYSAFLRMGLQTEPFIVNIIRNTGNDFCREWACEIYVHMFCKVYADIETRQKLIAIHRKEIRIYKNLKKFFKDPKKVEKLYESKQSLGNVLRVEWGKYYRYPMRLIAIIDLLDNLNKKNHNATVKLITKIIDAKNFDYNSLSNIYRHDRISPSTPEILSLRYLAKSVFKNDSTNTFQWLPKKSGGFSVEELKKAIKVNDKPRIYEMEKILHQFVCALLMNQLISGDGNREINLLKKFQFATWDKNLEWDDCILTVHNKSKHSIPLILTKKANIEKILTGKGVTADSAEEKNLEFHIPSNIKFLWFVPVGDYQIDVNFKKCEVKDNTIFKFNSRKFSIDESNLTLNIY